jgi:hypothetical protein
MLARLGFSPMDGESSTSPLYPDIKNMKSRLTFLKDIWVYSDDKIFTNMHRLWNSNISGVDTIRTNVIYKNKITSSGSDGDSGGSNSKKQKTEHTDTSNLQLLCSVI